MIQNETKNKIIAEKHKDCVSMFSKARGLMFAKEKSQQALVFHFRKERYISIHMYFVFFPIDLVYLNKNNRVVEIKRNIRPFAYYSPKKKAKYLLELKANTIERTNITLNDVIRIRN
jgi:uncharacterized protein